MDLIPLETNAPGFRVALLDTAQLPADRLESLSARYLSASEQAEFATLRHPARRIEWMAARVCLKEMLLRAGHFADPRQCELKKDQRGRPWLTAVTNAGDRSGQVDGSTAHDGSISHHGRYACACLATEPNTQVGVDIETISPRLLKVAQFVVSQRDRQLPESPPDACLAILWTLKEAASKAIGLGLGADLSNVICRAVGGGRHEVRIDEHRARLSAWHFLVDEFVIAVALMLRRPDAWGVAAASTLIEKESYRVIA